MMQVLCPDERYVIELHELGYSPAAIAREMEWPAAMVRDCLSRHGDEISLHAGAGDPVDVASVLSGAATGQAGGRA